MKYFKDTENNVYAFESDGSQDERITETMTLMSFDEVDRHLYPQKYLTDDEKQTLYLKSLKPLSRRQFMLALVENNLDEAIEAAIAAIEDEKQRKIISIEYKDAQSFERLSESVTFMCNLLNLSDEDVNAMWEYGQTL
ncbi:hypothetical protein DX910_14730 [Acinetobacter haemolyticus]|nr:hypothetical protein DX910_14730 [Acinetobacter haemolyticus]